MTYQGTALAQQQPAPKEPKQPITGTEHPCCSQAVRKPCVCRVRWECPVHGSWCVGSHE